VSPDPALERKLQDLPEDASKSSSLDTFAPGFLNLYSYADDNSLTKVDPNGQQAVPLTTVQLRAIARSQGIGAGLSGVQFNRAVGRAFQEFALRAFGFTENFTLFPSPARAAATGGLPASVIPDSVQPVTALKWWFIFPQVTVYPNSGFIEVKAVAGVINLSYSNHQIRGLIDVAARSPAGQAQGPPAVLGRLIFITTGDTIIGPDVLAEATRRGVAVWQSIALVQPGSSGGSTISFSPLIPLNPAVYGPKGVPVPIPGPPGGTLGPANSGGPPNNPDPTEVQ
jgi:hypothetical protein